MNCKVGRRRAHKHLGLLSGIACDVCTPDKKAITIRPDRTMAIIQKITCLAVNLDSFCIKRGLLYINVGNRNLKSILTKLKVDFEEDHEYIIKMQKPK